MYTGSKLWAFGIDLGELANGTGSYTGPAIGLGPSSVGYARRILLGLTISGIRGFTEGRPFYRPPGNPVLVGSGSYSPTQQGIPTHRYAPATVISTPSRRRHVLSPTSEGRGTEWHQASSGPSRLQSSMISRPVTAITACISAIKVCTRSV